MIFSQGKKTLTSPLYFDGIKLQLVDQYKYLGCEIFFNGNLKHSASALCDKSLKALLSLRSKLNNFENFPVRCWIIFLHHSSANIGIDLNNCDDNYFIAEVE